MSEPADVRRISWSDDLFEPLLAECEAEGGAFLLRMRSEWEDGVTRFDRPNEALFGALLGGRLVGVGGLTRDPWEPSLGRLRHLYVIRVERGRGVGGALVSRIIEAAKSGFAVVRLRSRDAGSFYEGFGFDPSAGPHETHRLVIGRRVNA